jgi:hypothetical protein
MLASYGSVFLLNSCMHARRGVEAVVFSLKPNSPRQDQNVNYDKITCARAVLIMTSLTGYAQGQGVPDDPGASEAALDLPVLTSVQRFTSSDASWGGDGKIAVCLSASVPASCPSAEPVISYNFSGSSWSADLSRIPGARWVWDGHQIVDGSAAENAEFTVTGVVNAPVCSGSTVLTGAIWVAADDFAEVFVNGALAGFTGSTTDPLASGANQELFPIPISPFLVPGITNVISVHAMNGPGQFTACQDCSYSSNPAAVVFGGQVGCISID